MRLPWPFGRVQRSASADGAAPTDAVTPTRAQPASGDAWRRLPPLAEIVGPPPLVAPVRPFAASLASAEPPAPILAPLSHGRSLEAPKGLVSGIARPAVAAPGTALRAPVQRSPLGRSRRGSEADAAPPWPDSPPAPEPEPASAPVAAGPTLPPVGPRLDIARVTPPVRRAMTQAPEPARALAVGLVGQPRASGAAVSQLVMPSPAAVQRAPITSPVPASTPAPPPLTARAPGADLVSAPSRLTLGQARRLGLGAPIAGGLVGSGAEAFTGLESAPPSPASTRTPAASAPDTGQAVQRSPADAPDLPLASRTPAPLADGVARPAPAPGSPTAAPARAAADAPVARGPVGAARSASTARVRATAAPSSPIVSARPLRAGVQRAPITGQAGHGEPAATPGAAAKSGTSSAAPVKIHRGGEASKLATALDARSFTHGAEIYLPSSHGPLTSGKGRSLLAHEMTHVAQQRRLGSSLPAEDSPRGRSLESEAVAAERAPDMTLATHANEPAGADAHSAGNTAPKQVTASATSAMASAPGVQRAPESGGSAPRSKQSDRSPTGHSHTEQELEVLAHQLYHRIGRHLRRELLVDRERAGFALDLR